MHNIRVCRYRAKKKGLDIAEKGKSHDDYGNISQEVADLSTVQELNINKMTEEVANTYNVQDFPHDHFEDQAIVDNNEEAVDNDHKEKEKERKRKSFNGTLFDQMDIHNTMSTKEMTKERVSQELDELQKILETEGLTLRHKQRDRLRGRIYYLKQKFKRMTETSNAETLPVQFKEHAVLDKGGKAEGDEDTGSNSCEIQNELWEGTRKSGRQRASLNYNDVQAGKLVNIPRYQIEASSTSRPETNSDYKLEKVARGRVLKLRQKEDRRIKRRVYNQRYRATKKGLTIEHRPRFNSDDVKFRQNEPRCSTSGSNIGTKDVKVKPYGTVYVTTGKEMLCESMVNPIINEIQSETPSVDMDVQDDSNTDCKQQTAGGYHRGSKCWNGCKETAVSSRRL